MRRMIPLKCLLCCCISVILFLLRSGCGARPLPAGTSEFAKDHHQSSRAAANLKVVSPEAAKNLKKGGEMSFQIGSRPPSCFNKCNSCFPCQAVQVPTPLSHKLASQGPLPALAAASSSSKSAMWTSSPPLAGESSSSSFSTRPSSSTAAAASPGQICSEYSNYKPEGWKCKCGNKLFNP